MHALTNAVRSYAWGSTTHIPRLLGRPPTGEPAAELWLGAHPGDPSRLSDGSRLDELIAADPVPWLGEAAAGAFGARLPYLMKVLAASEPLSLQVHPTMERARLGYAREDEAGIPIGAPQRNYQDTSHKPELIFALTRFEGMAGFRDPLKTAAILRMLRLPWLDELADACEAGSETPFQTLRTIVTELLALRPEDVEKRASELQQAAAEAGRRAHRLPRSRTAQQRGSVERESVRLFEQTTRLVGQYPADAGVLVTLFLNHVVLAAGEAMFIDAGVIHTYTSGLGVEIMASSDNVVRAGLTPKHVDTEELLAITDFTPMPAPLWQPVGNDPDDVHLVPPVTEFELHVMQAHPSCTPPPAGPRIALCLEGEVRLRSASDERRLTRGESVFVTPTDGPLTAIGSGRLAIASVPT